jgi:hypothetical protein
VAVSFEDSSGSNRVEDRELERELLAAGRADTVLPADMEQAWSKFAAGLGSVAAAATVAQAGGAAGATALVEGVASRASWLRHAAIAKWLLIGGVLGSALTMAWLRPPAPSESARAVATSARAAATSAVTTPSAGAMLGLSPPPLARTPGDASVVAPGIALPLQSATLSSKRLERSAALPPPRPSARDALQAGPGAGLGAEVSALDAVRTAISIGAWGDAQSLLGKYYADFPHGALSADAEVLAIEALQGAGRSAETERAARRFLARRPNDPQAARVRWLAGISERP